jgi:hypothetical protein
MNARRTNGKEVHGQCRGVWYAASGDSCRVVDIHFTPTPLDPQNRYEGHQVFSSLDDLKEWVDLNDLVGPPPERLTTEQEIQAIARFSDQECLDAEAAGCRVIYLDNAGVSCYQVVDAAGRGDAAKKWTPVVTDEQMATEQ